MKKSYLKELSSHLLGTVTDNPDALDYFSTDLSIFQIAPDAIVYPANTADVRKTVQFVAAHAAAGKPMSLIPRGGGSDLGGAALGEGIQVVLPAHMNKLLRLDRDIVTVQPGISCHTLQQTLHTHGRFIPSYPDSLGDTTTMGGAVANDASGEKSVKYGGIRQLIKGLKVVLSDGSLIQTHRISARELNRRKGLSTLEGELYRKVDSLLLDHHELIKKQTIHTPLNSAGYALDKVRAKDGSFDLGQAIIGAQGTLGVITEITLKTLPYNPRTTLIVGYFDSIEATAAATMRLRSLKPARLEFVDGHYIEYAQAEHPGEIAGLIPGKLPKAILLMELDDFSQLRQKISANHARHIMARHGATVRSSADPVEQVALWKLRHSSAAAVWLDFGTKKAIPAIEDAVVPVERMASFLEKTYKLLKKHDLDIAIWGSAGMGNFHVQPSLDIGRKKDVDKLFTLSHEFTQLVASLGGTTSGGAGDGLLRALSLNDLYGEEMVELFASLKHIFDPQNIFNPLKKTQATESYVRDHIRSVYTLKHFNNVLYL